MTWTTTKPTVPGWYWWRWNHGRPMMCEVVRHYSGDGTLWESKGGNLYQLPHGELAEWAGPIHEPEERP
jgi:hypothetical protein